jgi:hypothetical protein
LDEQSLTFEGADDRSMLLEVKHAPLGAEHAVLAEERLAGVPQMGSLLLDSGTVIRVQPPVRVGQVLILRDAQAR